MVARILSLRPGEPSRVAPYFALYGLLFAALSVADGLSLALFVQRVGTEHLPRAYALAAAANLAAIGLYLSQIERRGCRAMFHAILAGVAIAMIAAWIGLTWHGGGLAWCGLLFVARETAQTLVLMHFGTYLQERFDRDALNRAFPIVYAGGRVGGIVGGWLLATLAGPLGIANLALAVAVIAVAASASELWLSRREGSRSGLPSRTLASELTSPAAHACPQVLDRASNDYEDDACHSPRAFLAFAWRCPLLFWITLGSLAFVVCRWLLCYQYNHVFERHFADDLAMARFLGRYTQIALALSLVVQLLLVNRLLHWIGVRGTHLLYAVLVLAALAATVAAPGLAAAVFARLVETELRFALRNPAAQWLTNVFSRPLRIRVRAWSLGLLIPLGTLLAAALLGGLDRLGKELLIPLAGLLMGLGYVATSLALLGIDLEPRGRESFAASDPPDRKTALREKLPTPSSPQPAVSTLATTR